MNAAKFRSWHKWLFLLFGVQMLMWMIGGFYMVAVPLTIIHGDHLIKEDRPVAVSAAPDADDLKRILNATENVVGIAPAPQIGETVLKVQFVDQSRLYDLATNAFIASPGANDIERIAREIFKDDTADVAVDLLAEPLSELQGRSMPLWRAEFSGPFRPTLYFSPETGELVSRRHDLWRVFDFMWMLHIMDYEARENINNALLQVFAGINLIAVISGLFLVYHTVKKNRGANKENRSSLIASLHKWLGLIIGVQLFIWVASGLGMSLIAKDVIDPLRIVEKEEKQFLEATDIGRGAEEVLAPSGKSTWALEIINRDPVFVIEENGNLEARRAISGEKLEIGEASARAIANDLYAGNGAIRTVRYLFRPGVENRTFPGPAWRVDFSDKAGTTFYISAQTGELQASRNNLWRLFDTLWMLHMMDYGRTNSFNAPWIVLAGLASVFIGLSGVILVTRSFRATDFVPSVLRPAYAISVDYAGKPEGPRRLTARRGDTLFSVLQKNKIAVASSCGGGGTCGQCVVEVRKGSPQISQADRRHLTQEEIKNGARLSCQRRVYTDEIIVLPEPLSFVGATIIENRELSAGMREIILQLPSPEAHAAGQHRFFEAPAYHLDKDEAQFATGDMRAKQFVNRREVLRSYSMSAPSGDGSVMNSFIVRKMPAPKRGAPPGVGATFLCSRRPGDIVRISQPRGAFRISDSDSPAVLIGGGAGMAPLRAMILDLLSVRNDPRRIAFFYGARNTPDLIFLAEFETLAARHSNFSIDCAISNGEGAEGRWPVSHIHELAREKITEAGSRIEIASCEFYLCGPPIMLAATEAMLAELGVNKERIFIDDFGI